MPCHWVGTSPNATHAIVMAKSGCRLEYIDVRVGPRRLRPKYQKAVATTSAMMRCSQGGPGRNGSVSHDAPLLQCAYTEDQSAAGERYAVTSTPIRGKLV